jgi:hypothetical protein
VERATHSDCPVCMEYMFNSRDPSISLRCGHVVHIKCQEQLLERGVYKCPLCSKAFLSRKQMKSYYSAIDEAVRTTEMPEKYRNMQVKIHCNDCNQSSETLFHFHGLKCTALVRLEEEEKDEESEEEQKNSTEHHACDDVDDNAGHISTTPRNNTDSTEETSVEEVAVKKESDDGMWEICGSFNTRRA